MSETRSLEIMLRNHISLIPGPSFIAMACKALAPEHRNPYAIPATPPMPAGRKAEAEEVCARFGVRPKSKRMLNS
jgi:hypothetical protein